jgi:hypothetical protein
MPPDAPSRFHLADSGLFWFAASALGSIGGIWLNRRAFQGTSSPEGAALAAAVAGLVLILLAGVAAWRLARAGLYAWLLPLAAVCLLLLQPGRAGDPLTWRLEWGVMGLVWTLAAILVFGRLLRRSDELERRLHLEGASFALVCGLVASVAYALFETRLPELRGQWVAVALLVSWWAGYVVAARRYRWRT